MGVDAGDADNVIPQTAELQGTARALVPHVRDLLEKIKREQIREEGTSAERFMAGDRVCFDSTVYCNRCAACRAGFVNRCENRQVLGVSGDFALGLPFGTVVNGLPPFAAIAV